MEFPPSNSPLTNTRTIFVSNISGGVTETALREFFELCGVIEHMDIRIVREEEDSYQTATIIFEDDSDMKTALLLNNTFMIDRTISVTADEFVPEKSGQSGQMDVLTDIVANTCIWGAKLWKNVLDFDAAHQITATILEKTTEVDDALKISENVKLVIKTVGDVNDNVDNLFQITENKNKVVRKITDCYTAYKHRTEDHEKFFQDLELVVKKSVHDTINVVQKQIDIVKSKIERADDNTEDIMMTEMTEMSQPSLIAKEETPLLSDISSKN